ncbi:MAG: hypothetical protein CMN58_04755 [Solibacterales bacterium]|nr:hypothetical protein [Bryobacterales bacterium]|tara:strand:+ start:5490 stop:6089 length:600 start_codon:yes stop_codon:yes gene_type:complete
MIVYAITDRRSLKDDLLGTVERQLHAGIDYLQIREKDLTDRHLFELTRAVLSLPNPTSTKILVNGRVDIAIAAGAAGVHLPSNGLGIRKIRRSIPIDLLVAVSTHSLEEVVVAEKDGADLAVFGPVFSTPSKASFGSPQGLEALSVVCQSVSMPVLALGGVTVHNAVSCVDRGAAGVAAISLLQSPAELDCLVGKLHKV